ncbi:UNVERIFIED_CONTAM: Vacuolar membrane protease [Sesamum radiatum]|uniref:Vacuolar membrane protease n=1 Tax=Sesamum radiatum TaxID=300843 RepID=A0AAW2TGL7_SESRA
MSSSPLDKMIISSSLVDWINMRQRPKGASSKSNLSGGAASGEISNQGNSGDKFESLPVPQTLDQVGKRGFSEHEAMKHVEALTRLGPHPVGSDTLESALKYVTEAIETIKKKAHWEVDMEVDLFHAKYGANNLVGGLFKGKTLVYSDLNHVVLRITPKYASEAGENAILVSSHIDTVFAAEGAGDCSSCVAVMLELARGVSQWAHGFKNAVIFLFNTGEEEGLNGAHSFITQHPWSDTIRIAIDLEAMGIGGKSGIFQAGPHPWAIENFALVAKYPSAQIVAQDIFLSGAIKSATDFQVYKELAGLSGLDFAYADNTAVYHTKNDKLKLLKPGSLQHLGENMLAFLLHAAASSSLPKGKATESDIESSQDKAIYFDVLYHIPNPGNIHDHVSSAPRQYALQFSNIAITFTMVYITAHGWLFSSYITGPIMFESGTYVDISISFSAVVAFILPLISSSPVPFVSSPWLVVGLFGAPALLGAFLGQHVGFIVLESYYSRTLPERRKNLPANLQSSVAKLDAERWLYKAGLLQWLVLLMVGNYYRIGSTYLALAWLVSPAFAYGLLEATLSPARMPKPLKTLTLLIGLFVPFLLSSGMVIRLSATIIGTAVRFVRLVLHCLDPGTTPEWMGNVVVAIFIAAIVCLTLVYLLSYIHISGVFPPFTEDTARAVNVVHVVDATRTNGGKLEPVSYISLFSTTPGNLIKEADHIGEGFVCGADRHLDFVTFSVNYSCWTHKGAATGWLESDIPTIHVDKDVKGESRETQISINTRASTRWSLAINTREIDDFQLKDTDSSEELIPVGEKSSVDGWHTIQSPVGGSADQVNLSLFWNKNGTQTTMGNMKNDNRLLLRLRTDVDRSTPPMKTVLQKLPPWCSQFGKSTSPHTLAFLTSLSIF